MSKRLSNMGGGRFEFAPEQLDARKTLRDDIYASAYADLLVGLETALRRADGDVVTRESLEEWLCRKLVEELIRRRDAR
ncbi:hypothetical protein [Paenibacillus agaridevorans]|uniref:hypothetical protein n=1 Tax=Paenibacillus agaridevorans TaxID=171404 RepID=UPI001BE434A8|nr:hypothetical protein [Paenibacillus agaridevorans]